MATEPLQLSDVNASLLPRNLTGPIFERANELSAVQRLSRRVPLSIDATTSIPVPLDVPTADWVDEGARKPLSSGGVGVKTMTGKKIAVLIPVSEEVMRTNAGGLWTQLQNDLPLAFARAFDHAAIHGKSMKGATGPFPGYLAQTTNTQALGTTSQAQGGIYADLVKGMEQVVDADYEFSGFVADSRLKPKLLLSTDTTGRPIFVDTVTPGQNAGSGEGTLIGEPIMYSRGVSGKYRRQSTLTDTGLRAVGGDWQQCAYGVGMDITVRVSREATYVDEDNVVHSAFQENLVLLLAEAYYGFVVGDADAFVTYTDAGGAS
ncbi:phage major capsid protein [Nocardiopsis tropica]|uniref:Phage major capsid protein n=2 Tax=Nocardiopsis tropica TaxID=109330 RepID=A0ABU7L2Q4_9ACTN|nr:phage major capsid protein [Nocardiopsis umidischolae]MEE2055826.1 phage major capsid protein [Nocardiopsis umidischolae]